MLEYQYTYCSCPICKEDRRYCEHTEEDEECWQECINDKAIEYYEYSKEIWGDI